MPPHSSPGGNRADRDEPLHCQFCFQAHRSRDCPWAILLPAINLHGFFFGIGPNWARRTLYRGDAIPRVPIPLVPLRRVPLPLPFRMPWENNDRASTSASPGTQPGAAVSGTQGTGSTAQENGASGENTETEELEHAVSEVSLESPDNELD